MKYNYFYISNHELKQGKGYIKEFKYSNDNLIFEGEYLNGKRNGKGKEYYDKGKLKFEGEYCFGKKWNGKEYDEFNNAIPYISDF